MLNEKTKKNIAVRTGLGVEEIIKMDFDDIDRAVEKKIGKKLFHPKKWDERLLGRGQIYSYLGKLLDMSRINRKLKKIK